MKNAAAELLRWNDGRTGTQTRRVAVANEKRTKLHVVWALLSFGSLIQIAASTISFAQVRPDTFVAMSQITKEGHPVKGTVEKIIVTVGNLSNVPPPPDVHYTALLRVFTSADQLVCQSNAYYGSLPPGNSFKALQFQVAHPSPIAQLGPAQSAQPKGPPIAEVGPVLNHVQYRILVNLIPTKPCPQVDSNCNNNMLNPTIQFSAGGTPSCLKLQ
jgi:hypothetical protein